MCGERSIKSSHIMQSQWDESIIREFGQRDANMKEKKKKPSSQRKDINRHKQNKIKVINKAVIETNSHISLAREIKKKKGGGDSRHPSVKAVKIKRQEAEKKRKKSRYEERYEA